MEITVNQIKKVLNQAIKDLSSGKIKNKNIIFIGETRVGINEAIDKCRAQDFPRVMGHEVYPESSTYYTFDDDWHLVEKVNDEKNIFDDETLEKIKECVIVLFCYDLTRYTPELIKTFESIVKTRSCKTPLSNNFYDLSKLRLVIFTILPNNSKDNDRVSDVSYLKENCDVYNVKISVKEFWNYFWNEKVGELCVAFLPYLDSKDKLNEDKFNEIYGKTLKKLYFFKKILFSPNFHLIYDNDELFTLNDIDELYEKIKNEDNKSIEEAIMSEIENYGDKTKEIIKKIIEEIKD